MVGWSLYFINLSFIEESPGSMETECRVIPGEGDLRESATENKPPIYW